MLTNNKKLESSSALPVSARTRMNRMMHIPMVYAIKELFHNAKTNIDNQPVGKVVSPKQECDLRQPQELSREL